MEETYEFLVLTAVIIHANVGFAGLVENLEGEVLDIGLNFGILESLVLTAVIHANVGFAGLVEGKCLISD